MEKQQNETYNFFKKDAQHWGEKAKNVEENVVNIIKQRNDYVLSVAQEKDNGKSLDVGCGTGELACELSKRGFDACGLDFAEEMITIAKENGKDLPVEFVCDSIFDFNMGRETYDLISANGFIEYISFDQMKTFFDDVYKALKKDGDFIFGSRNRLFNAFSCNKYTEDEIKNNTISNLLRESIQYSMIEDVSELKITEFVSYQHEDHTHENTGIMVTTRFQYTPLQIMDILQKTGFKIVDIYPIHYHAFAPKFKGNHMEMHSFIANEVQKVSDKAYSLIPNASSFMLHAVKVR